MSISASLLRTVYKLSGAKKAFALPEDALQRKSKSRTGTAAFLRPLTAREYYETIPVNGFPCLIVRERPKPSERAILYFFGGGMVIGPDKGDLPVMRKLCRETGCDVWFPFTRSVRSTALRKPMIWCTNVTEKMIEMYGGNVSTCGFSSGGALALGIAAHNNAQPEPLPQLRHIVAVSPGEVPWNDAERARMQALNERDVSIDYAFMVTVRSSCGTAARMCRTICFPALGGDFTGVGDIHFFYSADEVLFTALCRILRKPANGQMSPIRRLPARRWCIATVCCRSSGRQRGLCENRGDFEEMRPETVFTLSQTRRPPTGAACKRRNHER